MAYLAVGLLLFIFSHELAQGLNRFSVSSLRNFSNAQKNTFFASGWLDQQLQEYVFISQGNRLSHGHCRRCFYRHGSAAPELDGTVC
jgi:hypothetical protein